MKFKVIKKWKRISSAAMVVFMYMAIILWFQGEGSAHPHPEVKPENADKVFKEGAMIDTYNIGGLWFHEAFLNLDHDVEGFVEKSQITLRYNDKSLQLDTKVYQFEVEPSLERVYDLGSGTLAVSINEGFLKSQLTQLVTTANVGFVDHAGLSTRLLEISSTLEPKQLEIDLTEYVSIIDNKNAISQVVLSYQAKDSLLHSWVKQLHQTEIPSNGIFSLLSTLEAKDVKTVQSESLNVLATGIYQAALKTNFNILERHIGRTLPSYAAIGLEAKVLPGRADLVFENTNSSPYTLELSYSSNQLIVTIKGEPLPNRYDIKTAEERKFKPKTIVHATTDFVREGKEGAMAQVYRVVLNEKNEVVDKVLISEDFYAPIQKVIQGSVN